MLLREMRKDPQVCAASFVRKHRRFNWWSANQRGGSALCLAPRFCTEWLTTRCAECSVVNS